MYYEEFPLFNQSKTDVFPETKISPRLFEKLPGDREERSRLRERDFCSKVYREVKCDFPLV